MAVSVIIPVYNVEKYLAKCLDSVCAQDDCVKEIILINDGSTDHGLDICKEYAKKDLRIKIINQENKGLSATVRIGVNAASCEYIGFVDSDDYIEPNMFRIMYDNIRNTDSDIAICDYDLVSENTDSKQCEISVKSSGKVYDKIDGKFDLPILPTLEDFTNISGSRCNKLIRRELLINNIGFKNYNIRVGEDIALTIPAIFAAQRIVYLQYNLYHYFQRSNSIVYTYSRENFDDWLKIKNILSVAINEYKYSLQNESSTMLALLYSVCFSKIRKSSLTFSQRKLEIAKIGNNDIVQSLIKDVELSKIKSKFGKFFKLLKHKYFGLLAFLIKVGA